MQPFHRKVQDDQDTGGIYVTVTTTESDTNVANELSAVQR
jgi:hypothetical protein